MAFSRNIRVWEDAPNDFLQNYNRNNLPLTSNNHLSNQPPPLRSASVHSSNGFSSGSVNTHLNHTRGLNLSTPGFNRGISERSNKNFERNPILNNMERVKMQLRQQTSPINQHEPIRNFEQLNQTSNGMQPQGQQAQSDNILRQQVFLHPPPMVNNFTPLQTHPQPQFQQPPQVPVFSNSGQQQTQFLQPQPQIPLFSNSAQQTPFQPPQSPISMLSTSGQQQAQFQQPQPSVPVFSSQQQPKFQNPAFGNCGQQETHFPQTSLPMYGNSGQPQPQFQQVQFGNAPQTQPSFVPGTLQGNTVSPPQVQRGTFLPSGQPQFQNPILVNMGQTQSQQGLLPNGVRPTFHQNQMLCNVGESRENKTQISDYSPSLQKTSIFGSAFQHSAICGNVEQSPFQSTPMSGNFGHPSQFQQRPIFNHGLQHRPPLIGKLSQQQVQFQPRSATGIVRPQQIQFQPRSIISNIGQQQTQFQQTKEQKQMPLLGNLNQTSQSFAGRFSNDRSWNQNPSFNNNRSSYENKDRFNKYPSPQKINFENRMGNRNRNNPYGMKEKHSSKQNVKEMSFSCDTCDRAFSQEDELKRHVREHVKCKINGCQFEAHFKVVALHQKMQHDTGYAEAISKLDNAEEIEKWRKARRDNFPTTENIRKRKAAQAEKEARGEVLETKDFGKFKRARTEQNNSSCDGPQNPRNGRNRFRNNRRRNDSNPRPLRSSSQKTEVIVIDSDSDDDSHIKLPRFGGLSALLKQELSDIGDQSDVVYEKSVEASTELTQSKLPVSIASAKLPLPTQCDSSEILEAETNSSKLDEGKDIESHASGPIHEESVIQIEDSDVLSSETVDLVSSSNEQNGTLDSDDEAPSVEPIQKTPSADNPIVAVDATSKLPDSEQAASENGPQKDYKRNNDGSNMNKSFNRKPYNRAVHHPVRKSTLLEKLLADDIRHERNVILQCVRHIVNNGFFDK